MVSPGRQVKTVVLESEEPARRLVMQTQNQWSPGKKIPPIARRMLVSSKDCMQTSRFRVEDLDQSHVSVRHRYKQEWLKSGRQGQHS